MRKACRTVMRKASMEALCGNLFFYPCEWFSKLGYFMECLEFCSRRKAIPTKYEMWNWKEKRNTKQPLPKKTVHTTNKTKSLILIGRCLKCFVKLDKNTVATKTAVACQNVLELPIAIGDYSGWNESCDLPNLYLCIFSELWSNLKTSVFILLWNKIQFWNFDGLI